MMTLFFLRITLRKKNFEINQIKSHKFALNLKLLELVWKMIELVKLK